MILDEWEHEMSQMLDSFANQAIQSLGKINRRFVTLGRPFDEKFRQHFLKMSNQRLDLSFDTVLFSTEPVQRTKSENANNISSSTEAKMHIVNSVKVENNFDDELIEIYDSDDDENPKVHMAIDLADSDIEIKENIDSLELSVGNQSLDDQQLDAANLNGENDVKPFVKDESIAAEMADIPVVAFDPNKNNESADVANEEGESSKIRGSNPPSNVVIKRLKHCGGKRLKCQHCESFFQFESRLKSHQKVHVREKLLGVKADSNGLYHCTQCVRRFTDVRHLNFHMKTHKDDQYLYYCSRCMCPFNQEVDKNNHESQCEGRYYECHLCKVYVITYKSKMQIHMRTHTGAKPSRCMVCDKSFQTKYHLRRHLNTIHGRNML